LPAIVAIALGRAGNFAAAGLPVGAVKLYGDCQHPASRIPKKTPVKTLGMAVA